MKMAISKWQGSTNKLPPNLTFIGLDEWFSLLASGLHQWEWDIKWLTQIDRDHPLYNRHLKNLLKQSDRTGIGWVEGGPTRMYFKFSECEHDYRSEQIGRCEMRQTCTKCGHHFTVDSS